MNTDPDFWQKAMRHVDIPSKGLLEHSHFGYMWTSVLSQKIVASHTVYALLEMEPYSEFLTVEKWHHYVHAKDLQRLLEAEEQLLNNNVPVTIEYRLVLPNKTEKYISHT